MAPDRLKFSQDQGLLLTKLVSRATDFKLIPRKEQTEPVITDEWKLLPGLGDLRDGTRIKLHPPGKRELPQMVHKD
jgi:hypothetical protein